MPMSMFESLDVYRMPDEGYIQEEIKKIDEIVQDYCEASRFPYDRVEANVKTLKDIVIRVHKRQAYIYCFHDRMKPNEYKISALYTFWILKLRPYWVAIIDGDDEDYLDIATRINEFIALYIVLSIVKEFNAHFIKNGRGLLDDYIDELLYSFRYRDISKEAMYLMFDPFYYMYNLNESVDQEGGAIL